MLALWAHPFRFIGETPRAGFAGKLAIAGFALALAGVCFLAGARRNGGSPERNLALRLLAALYFGLACYGLAAVAWNLQVPPGSSASNLQPMMGLALAIVTGFYLQVLHRAASHAEEVANSLEEKIKQIDSRFKDQETVNLVIQTQFQHSLSLNRAFFQPLINAQIRMEDGKADTARWKKLNALLLTQDRLLTLALPDSSPYQMIETARAIADKHDAPSLNEPDYLPHLQSLAKLVALQIERRFPDGKPEEVALTLEALHGYALYGEWKVRQT